MKRLKLSVCPNCGNKKLKRVRKAVTGTRQGKRYSVPSVEFYECPDCGERVYDPEAVRQIEQHSQTATLGQWLINARNIRAKLPVTREVSGVVEDDARDDVSGARDE